MGHFCFWNFTTLTTIFLNVEYSDIEVKTVALESDSPSSHPFLAEGIWEVTSQCRVIVIAIPFRQLLKLGNLLLTLNKRNWYSHSFGG